MPVRLRITCLFTLLVFIILGVVCLSIYYFSETSRLGTIKTRLFNRAITSSRLLTHAGSIDQSLMRRVDSLTTLALMKKSVQAYDSSNRLIYYYSDIIGDSANIDAEILQSARENGNVYFMQDEKEAVAYYNSNNPEGITVICAGEDVDGNRNLEQLETILFFSFISGTLLAFAGGLFFSRGLLKPVSKITSEVKDISAYNLDRRIDTGRSKDEWQELAVTLNQLLDRLKESFELQRRFISNASHELSTPLTLISSQLEISLQRNRKDEEYRSTMTMVLKDVQHMSHLVQTLLKFATASGNPGGLQIDMVRIDEVLMRLPGEMRSKHKENSVSLHFGSLPENEDRLLVFGNEELLFAAIQNIVSNACKYSPDHHADVYLQVDKGGFVISIADKGIGMEESELKNIFQPFYRIQQSGNTEGFGLGLSLASRIIKLHKGELKATSVIGSGTTFTIKLPATKIL